MGSIDQFPSNNFDGKCNEEDFDSVCCHPDEISCDLLSGCRNSKNFDSLESVGLHKVYAEKCENDAHSKKAKREHEELSDRGKQNSGKTAKRKKKATFELLDSEPQSPFQEDTSEAFCASNQQRCARVKKARKHNVHLQRRILANARERSRVHKLGEAFRMLRNVIPSFSPNQKLSKLSTLRIAVSYISALGSLLDLDVKPGAKQVFTSSVNQCTFALQSEFGRAKGTRKIKSKLGKSTKCKRTKSS